MCLVNALLLQAIRLPTAQEMRHFDPLVCISYPKSAEKLALENLTFEILFAALVS